MKTGWERENRTHFDEIVINYDKSRWDYPMRMFEDIFAYMGSDNGKNALEIGAGTGKATTPVLDAGFDVTAVELGKNMADYLLNKFKGCNNFMVINEAFEDAKLPDISYDLIYSASAFHWIDAEMGCPRAYRLLKPGGVFALLRNNIYTAVGYKLDDEIQAVYDKYFFSYFTEKRRVHRTSQAEFKSDPSFILHNFGFKDLETYGFSDVALNFYDKTMEYTADGFINLLETMSDHRELPAENRAALYDGIKNAINKYGGVYRQDTVFTLYMGRRAE